MVTEQAWRSRFGSDPAIVSRPLLLGDVLRPTTVVGILPAGARISPRIVPAFITVLPRGREYPRGALVSILARMKPGVTADTVETELLALTPPSPRDPSDRPDVATPAELFLGEPFSRGVWLVFAGALGLLVIAIVNAGHLLLVRATTRSHELGVRLALGGSTLRLARLFFAEALVYVGSGLALGVAVMIALERLVQQYEPRLFMTMAGAGLDGRALWFIGAVAGAAMLACAAVPLLRSRRQDLRAVIDAGGAARSTWRTSRAMSALVITQAAVAVLLIVGAAVMMRSFRNLMAVDSGLAIHELVEISAVAPSVRYTTPEARGAYRQQVEAELQAIPTVAGVTTSGMPLLSTSTQDGLPYLDGEEKPTDTGDASTGLTSVPLNYFDVTGTRLIAGRLFRPDDGQDVAVVNEAFAASRAGEVIGRLVHTPSGRQPFRIVGVVANVKSFGIADRQTRYQVYFKERRSDPDSFVRFFVRTTGDPAAVIQEARRRIAEIDRAVPMFAPETGTQVVRRQTSQHRFVAVLLAGLAALGFGLALSGVYGSVALNASRRTREIGIRMALGATRRAVVRHVLGSGLRMVAIGGAAGVAGAWLALPSVEVLLYDVSARDPSSTIGSVVIVAVAAAFASWIPARRASRVDPAVTLRQA
jgi:predicted permease